MRTKAIILALATVGLVFQQGRSEPVPRAANYQPAQGVAGATAGGQPSSPNELLAAAVQTTEGRVSIAAQIRYRVALFDKALVGNGIYFEHHSADGVRFRFELKTQLGDENGTLLEVCDGQSIWRYQRLHELGELSRIDVVRVLEALEEAGQINRLREVGNWPGLGGVPRMLRGLHGAFDFHSAEPNELAGGTAGSATATQRLPVWRLQGGWKPDRLKTLLPDRAEEIASGKPIDLTQLPQPLPESVVIYLGKDDLFPYRVDYCRSDRSEAGQGRGVVQPIVTLEFFYVNLNVPVDPNRFRYNPGNLECVDRTQEFLQKLGLR